MKTFQQFTLSSAVGKLKMFSSLSRADCADSVQYIIGMHYTKLSEIMLVPTVI